MLTLLILLIRWYLEGEITMPWTRRCRATVHSLPFPHSEWKLNGCWIKIIPLGCKTALNEYGLWISTRFICSKHAPWEHHFRVSTRFMIFATSLSGSMSLWWFHTNGQLRFAALLSHSPSSKEQKEKMWWKKTQGLRWREYLPVTRMGKTNSTYGD